MKRRALNVLSRLTLPVVILSALVLPACGVGDTPATPPTEGPAGLQVDSYTIADPTGDWGYPSPYAHYFRGPGYVRMQFVFETLVWKNADSFVPQLARDWEYLASDNAYLFTLQENVQWHDGTAFTADDVVFTYSYGKEHPYQMVDNSIVQSAEAVDTHTVKLHLSEPYAPFLQNVAGTQPILPKHIWESVTAPEEFLTPDAAVGTGPYVLADYSKEHGTYLFEANESYYLGTPTARELRFVKVAAEMSPAALKEGTVDATSIPADVAKDIEAAGFTVITNPPAWNGKLTINHKKEPLSSTELRRALAYAIDREALVQIVFRGNALAGSPGIMPPTSVWYNPETPRYDYSPDEARRLIEGLGYHQEGDYFSKDGQPLRLSLIAAADYKDVGQFITQQLEQLGIDVEFQTLEGKTVDARVGAWDFDLSIYGHGGLYEPSILKRVILDDGFNSARYDANPELTGLLRDQLTEMDAGKRKDMVFRIQTLYGQDLPALTLYYPTWYWAHDSTFTPYYTMDGIALGVPFPLNRMCFVK